jgi:hypothetical protein
MGFETVFIEVGGSLIYTRKRKGPNFGPFVASCYTLFQFEQAESYMSDSITTLLFLLVRYDSNHLLAFQCE